MLFILMIKASKKRLLLWAHRDLNPEPTDYESELNLIIINRYVNCIKILKVFRNLVPNF